MGYYLGVSYNQPRVGMGARGGFFSSIGSLFRSVATPVLTAINPALGAAYTVARGALQHPVVSAAAGAATATAVGSAISRHTGGSAATQSVGVPPLSVHGHLHVG